MTIRLTAAQRDGTVYLFSPCSDGRHLVDRHVHQ